MCENQIITQVQKRHASRLGLAISYGGSDQVIS